MERKQKLANLILMEVESLKTTESLIGQQLLAEEITKDAIALAQLVQEEHNQLTKENEMAKIIGIKSRQEITELPFNQNDAAKAIEALIDAKISDPIMFARILNFISNNSGVSAMEVQMARLAKKVGK